jgi:4-hydroxy-tetrahydrodipicolinate synthase
MALFKGAGVAIVTPMKINEDVNFDKLEEIINWQIEEGTDSIIIAGTTGEASTLTMEEHRQVIKAAVDFTNHRVPVIAGTGSNCTRTAIQLSQEAEEDGAEEETRKTFTGGVKWNSTSPTRALKSSRPAKLNC